MNGLLILNKGEGITSQTAVSRVRRLFGGVKAGHTGTLDPMATGVLPILLGNATKAGDFLLSSVKNYEAVLRLGLTTDTEDTTGAVLTQTDRIPPAEEVLRVLEGFRGESLQTPPMYSALKVNGQKLVDLARAGKEVDRAPRPITVFRLSAKQLSQQDYALSLSVSKGTYIRTLCADIGAALGCGGCMAALCRSEAGGFSLEEAVTLEALEEMSPAERCKTVKPVSQIFASWPHITLSAFYSRLARCGCPISLSSLHISLPLGERVSLWEGEEFFAIAEVVEENYQRPGTGPALRPLRQFPKDKPDQ